MYSVRTNPFGQELQAVLGDNNGLKKDLAYGGAKSTIQKTYQVASGFDLINIEFLGSNRQFDLQELSLVFNKSDKHTSLYDSYNAELAAKYIRLVKLSNFTEIYSLTNEKKYEMDNLTQLNTCFRNICCLSL